MGPNCSLEGCTIENSAFVGMGATVKEGATVKAHGVVAAGSVVTENTLIESYQVWAGNPA